jgi:hypothetical protein
MGEVSGTKNCRKWVWPSICWKTHSKAVHLLEKSVINRIWQLLLVCDSPIIIELMVFWVSSRLEC